MVGNAADGTQRPDHQRQPASAAIARPATAQRNPPAGLAGRARGLCRGNSTARAPARCLARDSQQLDEELAAFAELLPVEQLQRWREDPAQTFMQLDASIATRLQQLQAQSELSEELRQANSAATTNSCNSAIAGRNRQAAACDWLSAKASARLPAGAADQPWRAKQRQRLATSAGCGHPDCAANPDRD